jgi:hypothetical protein
MTPKRPTKRDPTPFEKMRELTRRLVAVPKREVDTRKKSKPRRKPRM